MKARPFDLARSVEGNIKIDNILLLLTHISRLLLFPLCPSRQMENGRKKSGQTQNQSLPLLHARLTNHIIMGALSLQFKNSTDNFCICNSYDALFASFSLKRY